MIIRGKEIGIVPECESTIVFDNHIEIPIEIDTGDMDFISSVFNISKKGSVTASLLIPLYENRININDISFIHILDSYIQRTDNYDGFIDRLFKNKDYKELRNVAERCELSVIERIEILGNYIPLAN